MEINKYISPHWLQALLSNLHATAEASVPCQNRLHSSGQRGTQALYRLLFRMKWSREMSEVHSLPVKYEWNSAWQEKWGSSPGDREQCACVLLGALILRVARDLHPAAPHKWAPGLAWQRQAAGFGNARDPGPGRASTAVAKPGDVPVRLLDFLRHTAGANSQPGPFKHALQGWLQRALCAPPQFLTPRRSRGSHPVWMAALASSLSALCSQTPLCLFLFLSVHPTDFLLICYLTLVSPHSRSPFCLFSLPAHLYSFPLQWRNQIVVLSRDVIKVLCLKFNSGKVAVKKRINYKALYPLNVRRIRCRLENYDWCSAGTG